MRLGLSIDLSGSPTRGGSRYASDALAVDFINRRYYSNGAQATSLSAVPGYTFTRIGTYTHDVAPFEVFAANVPPVIVGEGFISTLAAHPAGASYLQVNVNAAVDENQFFMAAVSFDGATQTANEAIFQVNQDVNERIAINRLANTGDIQFNRIIAGVATTTTISGAGAGRCVVLACRRDGGLVFGLKTAAGVVTLASAGASAWSAFANVAIGSNTSGGAQLIGATELFKQTKGTFTDAQLTAILRAA